eukprot:scaffold306385_cov18-Tisochrysis_lutea.AAC.1
MTGGKYHQYARGRDLRSTASCSSGLGEDPGATKPPLFSLSELTGYLWGCSISCPGMSYETTQRAGTSSVL